MCVRRWNGFRVLVCVCVFVCDEVDGHVMCAKLGGVRRLSWSLGALSNQSVRHSSSGSIKCLLEKCAIQQTYRRISGQLECGMVFLSSIEFQPDYGSLSNLRAPTMLGLG